MGILKGALSVRRYKVEGNPPEQFRDYIKEGLLAQAFHEPASKTHKEEVSGWVQVQNLLETNFEDYNSWLFEPYVLFSLRIDKKTVPATLLKAHVDLACKLWAENKGQPKCPAGVKREIKDQKELEMLKLTLPRVRTMEVCWNFDKGVVLFHSHSESANDHFRKLFHRTFGLELHAEQPAEWLDEDVATQIELRGNSDFSETGAEDGS